MGINSALWKIYSTNKPTARYIRSSIYFYSMCFGFSGLVSVANVSPPAKQAFPPRVAGLVFGDFINIILLGNRQNVVYRPVNDQSRRKGKKQESENDG